MYISQVPIIALTATAVLAACSSGTPSEPGDNVPPGSSVYSLGTLRTTSAGVPECPAGSTCRSIEVSCPAVKTAAPAYLSVAEPTAPPRGTLLFTTGGSGMGWAFRARDREALMEQLLGDGFRIVQLAWATNWLESSPGDTAGTAHLGCRPATVVKWVHETYFLPLGIARSSNGRCGFCITGNSGGATQSSYPLSHYRLEEILDAVIPTGGPPHSALSKSCLLRPGEAGYQYPPNTREFLDRGFGFFDGNGPCVRQDPSFTNRWDQASVATGGTDYNHPRTRVHFVFGENDEAQQTVGGDYADRLRNEGSPWVTSEIAAATGHGTMGTEQGRSAIRAAILATR